MSKEQEYLVSTERLPEFPLLVCVSAVQGDLCGEQKGWVVVWTNNSPSLLVLHPLVDRPWFLQGQVL